MVSSNRIVQTLAIASVVGASVFAGSGGVYAAGLKSY
jgi:hypothetical protein